MLDTETPVIGVTAGKVRLELGKRAGTSRPTNETVNLSHAAGWGRAGQGGVTMRGKGKLETRGDSAEAAEALAVVAADVRRTRAPKWCSMGPSYPKTEGGVGWCRPRCPGGFLPQIQGGQQMGDFNLWAFLNLREAF